ncbi:unnamed protein product [marine sediment metagenome]|uniref:Uncharacterized protein n=1 Tax=marine sediment metagenome TaxID=412755 RepID=X1HGJ4_9ZZZZ
MSLVGRTTKDAYDDIAGETVKEGDKVIRGLSLKLNLKNILYSATFFGLGFLLGASK